MSSFPYFHTFKYDSESIPRQLVPHATGTIWEKYTASGKIRYPIEQLAYNRKNVVMLRRIEEALTR